MDSGLTNVVLAEKDLLKEKIEYINDIAKDEILDEKSNDTTKKQTLIKIINVCIGRTCSNCQWWEKEDITKGMVCVNGDSDECTNWTDQNNSCSKFEERK